MGAEMYDNIAKWSPGKILELSGGYWAPFALHAGVELDIFTALEDKAMTEEEAAACLGISRRGAKSLLNALSAMGLLDKEGGRFSAGADSAKYLSKSSPDYLGYMIRHHHYLSAAWAGLPGSVRSGEPSGGPRSRDRNEKELEAFEMGMFNNASLLAPKVAEAVDLGSRKRLLDLGGGPATYSIHFCLRNPGLKAVVFDLPEVRPFAEKMIAAHGLSGRIEFAAGDFTADALPTGFDAAWLSHVIHGEGPVSAAGVVKKAGASLDQGGTMLIHEFILDDCGNAPLHPALFSLNMLIATKEGRSYTKGELEGFMRSAGISEIALLDLAGPSQSRILSGKKAGELP